MTNPIPTIPRRHHHGAVLKAQVLAECERPGHRRYAAQRRNPLFFCARARRNASFILEIRRVWDTNMRVYGVDKVWRQLHREKQTVVHCTVERLIRRMSIEGARLGKKVRTNVPDPAAPYPLDHVNQQFKADCPIFVFTSSLNRIAACPTECCSLVIWPSLTSVAAIICYDVINNKLLRIFLTFIPCLHRGDEHSQWTLLHTSCIAFFIASINTSVSFRDW
ncbi:IS3 family transposase [Herbaspirillum sp. GCM10030257]|uniref:IS3 family transposase n=1 Tax=Herbaspirillum sp. GCM10030257 TaxID=3273393 RepID=UPI00360DD893